MLNFKDASDFKGKNVNQILANQVYNMDILTSPKDINVAWHFNAFNKTATGSEVWYWLGDGVGYAIAKKLSATIAKTLGIVDRGPKATTNLYVIARSKAVTILPEICFIDNKTDIQKYQAKKNELFKAILDVFRSFPQYNFKSTHGGHHGLNMVDPGAIGNGYKEAALAQELNKALLSGQNAVTKPPVTTNPTPPAKNTKPVTNGKVGDKVKVFDVLFADSYGSGRSTGKQNSTGTIKKINDKGTKKYRIENWGWAHGENIQLVSSTPSFDIGKYHTKKFSMIEMVRDDYAYKEVALKTKVGSIVKKGTVLTVVGIEYSGQYPRFKLKSGLYVTTRKDTVKEYVKPQSTPKPKPKPTPPKPKPNPPKPPVQKTYPGFIYEKGRFTVTEPTGVVVRKGSHGLKAAKSGNLKKGNSVIYDGVAQKDGYVWIHYIGDGNVDLFAPVRSIGSETAWGTFTKA